MFSGQNFFQTQNFFLIQIIFDQKDFLDSFFFRPKTMFGERKQSFCFLNWQRAKVLLKLEFDTEDQVLLHKHFYLNSGAPSLLVVLCSFYALHSLIMLIM